MADEIDCSEEQAALGQSANELLGKRWDMSAVRRAMVTESGYDPAFYRELCALGWLGAAVPAEYGGAGLPFGVLANVFEAMGQSLFGSPFLAGTLAAQALLAAGTEAQKQRWLPALIEGKALGTLALSEPNGSYQLSPRQAHAQRGKGGLTLSGQKTLVLDAQHADFAIASIALDGTPALVLLEASALAGRIRPHTLIDETRRAAAVSLDGLHVGDEAVLDAADAGAALAHVQRAAWLLLSAEAAGGAEGVMQLTLDYLRTRKQFGKAIGSYQALKHPMVEIMIAIEQGRSLLYHAATMFEHDDPEREIALRMAKAQLGDTYVHASDRAIQFHGAIGFTYECHVQLFFRRAQWVQATFGDALHHRQALAELLWPRAG